jgi:hypothetical protein
MTSRHELIAQEKKQLINELEASLTNSYINPLAAGYRAWGQSDFLVF